MKKRFSFLIVIGFLILSGCGNIIDWTNDTFRQGKEYTPNKKIISRYMRTANIYDQLNTVALFDILWLSDDIKTLYADAYSRMHGRSKESHDALLRRQLQENNAFIVFYILSLHQISLVHESSSWSFFIKIGKNTYQPLEVKALEMEPEYSSFFGEKRYTKQKRPYVVKFDRKDPAGKDILDGAEKISLYISSPQHYTSVSWNIK